MEDTFVTQQRLKTTLAEFGNELKGWLIELLNQKFGRIEERLDHHGQQFDRIEERLDNHDRRFDRIDGRLSSHDKQFQSIDQRFDSVDQRFDEMAVMIKQGFDAVDERFNGVDARLENLQEQNEIRGQQNRHLAKRITSLELKQPA